MEKNYLNAVKVIKKLIASQGFKEKHGGVAKSKILQQPFFMYLSTKNKMVEGERY